MKIHILKDTTTEGLEAKINQVAEEAQGGQSIIFNIRPWRFRNLEGKRLWT